MDGKQISFIAQEFRKIIPTAVEETSETFGNTTISDLNVLDTSCLVPMLVDAVQEQQGQIEELKAENTELRSLIGQINARLTALAQ